MASSYLLYYELIFSIYVYKVFFFFFLTILIRSGIQTTGKVAIYTASGPYILLVILLIRGLFLDGALNGIAYLFSPDLSRIFDANVWVDAGTFNQ